MIQPSQVKSTSSKLLSCQSSIRILRYDTTRYDTIRYDTITGHIACSLTHSLTPPLYPSTKEEKSGKNLPGHHFFYLFDQNSFARFADP